MPGWPEVARDKIEPELLALMPALVGFAPPATVIDRAFYSAFAASPLHSHLHSRRVDTLLVTGAETDVCVLATVLAAVDLGYRVVVVKDALCSSSDETKPMRRC